MAYKEKIHTFPYLWEENPSVDYILKNYLWPLKLKVEEILKIKSWFVKKEFYRTDLPNNSNILPLSEIKELRNSLMDNLEKMYEILDWKKPIVFIADSCFTNKLLIKQLFSILFEDFDRFVDIVEIDYENPEKNKHIEDKLYNNSIIILWWSFSDTYTIPDSMYSWPLFELIKNVSRDTAWVEVNNKILWVCFGQQYINNIMWIDRIFSEKILTTYKWVSQFWLMPFEFDKWIRNIPYIYRAISDALTNHWQSKAFTWVLTRTWHVDFNLLNSYTVNSSSVVNIVNDVITWSPIIWGTKNWNILWNQAHLEINLFEDLRIVESETKQLIPFLRKNYWSNVERIIDNTKEVETIRNSMWDIFYISSLKELSHSIIKKYEFVKREQDNQREFIYYPEDVCKNFDNILLRWVNEFNFQQRSINENCVRKLDKEWKLKMLTTLDWKVWRWMNEIGKTLWLWDFSWFLSEHKKFINSLFLHQYKNWIILPKKDHKIWNKLPYVFRDFWAWNWELVKEIDQINWVSWYWVWDYAYFDIFDWIKKHNEFKDIPINVIKILVQELFDNFNHDPDKTHPELISEALDKVNFTTEIISDSSMFSDKTDMFNDSSKKLSKSDKDFIRHNKNRLIEIKDFIKNNFYELVDWYFLKLMVSDFWSLYIKNKYLKQADFQTAIRSTSHVDWWVLEQLLYQYVKFYSKPWSIYFDNWVVRSYSSVPRIREYIELEQKFDNIKIYFTYDTKTNYISSAVIIKEPYIDIKILEKHLDENVILLRSNELYENSFFRIERFYRELIILSFKDYKVFYNKNKEIIWFLKELSSKIKDMTMEEIKYAILIWINSLINSVNRDFWEKYLGLTINDLDFYISKVDPTIKKIFEWDIIIQDWFNTDFNRNN